MSACGGKYGMISQDAVHAACWFLDRKNEETWLSGQTKKRSCEGRGERGLAAMLGLRRLRSLSCVRRLAYQNARAVAAKPTAPAPAARLALSSQKTPASRPRRRGSRCRRRKWFAQRR